jgi:hypothetical protein
MAFAFCFIALPRLQVAEEKRARPFGADFPWFYRSTRGSESIISAHNKSTHDPYLLNEAEREERDYLFRK